MRFGGILDFAIGLTLSWHRRLSDYARAWQGKVIL